MGTRPGIAKRDTLRPRRFRRRLWPRGRQRAHRLCRRLVVIDLLVDRFPAHRHEPVVWPQDAQPASDRQRRVDAAQPYGHLRPQMTIQKVIRLFHAFAVRRSALHRWVRGNARPNGARARLEVFRTCTPVQLAFIGWTACVALDLPADGGYATAEHHADHPYAVAIADLNLDDLPFFFRQV